MRVVLLLAPALLLAQTPTPDKVPATIRRTAVTASKSSTAQHSPARRTAVRRRGIAAKPAAAAAPTLTTDEQKTIYALGLMMHRSLTRFDLSPAEIQLVGRALTDASAGKPAVEIQDWGPKIDALARERGSRQLEKQKAASAAYLEKAAIEPGAERLPSGLVYRELRPGLGASPRSTDQVKVHYRGTLIDGTEFDSSYRRNEPATFALNGVIKCWTEGVQKMKVGGKSLLVCPSDLAYGDGGRPAIPGGAALVFEVELLDVQTTP